MLQDILIPVSIVSILLNIGLMFILFSHKKTVVDTEDDLENQKLAQEAKALERTINN